MALSKESYQYLFDWSLLANNHLAEFTSDMVNGG
jgi:hypothetical protein